MVLNLSLFFFPEQAILNVRKTIAKSKNEVADTTQQEEISHINKEEGIDFERTPMKQPESIRELKTQGSALKSLKVKILNNIVKIIYKLIA